jgi:hypothetical protein
MEKEYKQEKNQNKVLTIKFLNQDKEAYYKTITHFDELTDSEKIEYFDICFRMKMKISKMKNSITTKKTNK